MCPREPVEKDERVRERKINRDGQATLVSSSCAGTGNNRGWLEFNGRAAQYAPAQTTSSMFFFFLFFFFPPFLSGFSLSLSLFAVSFQRSSRPVPSRLVSSPLETAEFSSLSRLLVQHVIIKPVVAAAISCHGSLTLSSNSSLSWPRWKSIFDDSVWDDFRITFSKRKSFRIFENLFQRYIWQRVMKTASIDLSF